MKNKELKKQKQKFEKGLNDFYSQMDQILSVHEQYLKKKWSFNILPSLSSYFKQTYGSNFYNPLNQQ